MKTITDAEYTEQWEASLQKHYLAYNTDGFDRVGKCQHQYSQDYFWEIQLRPGLMVEFIEDDYHRCLCKETYHDDSVTLVSKFYLSGVHRVLTPSVKGVKEDYEEKAGYSYLFFLPDIREIEISPANQRLQFLRIILELDLFRSFSTDFDILPAELQLLKESNSAPRFHQAMGKITAKMHNTLWDILNCPYHGMTKRMYLESKTLELLVLQLNQWSDDRNSTLTCTLQREDIERVYHAREILSRSLNNPPSLMNLARQVGLNDYKLKMGFRQLFGTTVFGYLQACRMEQAKQLLNERSLSVAGVAHTVGYASQSRFCHAFKRQFGMTPSTYRRA
ncbi:helix-turn-helix transcriptional regulator [Gloeocapsopsis dulcis]|uniref:HTH araC/xylS-type domain-containing protein n=1 Tax=Gloeocapsopsis dulcis AAB1 = 1H9 TaxID=1433147 RepID=A0A6N8FQG2_9CHRO|nr:AraC family transcriptional regulator [Gloeocapsopsis dulcis]MUL34902.1 hypothetical protein [Gloeocapsopsis dulcis AAB1 = 1H9]WNN90027.1 AraC family transcriptional regulator [Gloeocapsopsis dulcis]